MYGKIFVQIYDGSLYGRWEALVTFQQFIVLADKEGVVDMTPQALSARTSIPLEILERGIAELEKPDPQSRTPDEDGRRILRVSEERSWGWIITNYQKYREIRSAEERREYMRLYQRERRSKRSTLSTGVNQQLTPVSNVNQSSKQYAVSNKKGRFRAQPPQPNSTVAPIGKADPPAEGPPPCATCGGRWDYQTGRLALHHVAPCVGSPASEAP